MTNGQPDSGHDLSDSEHEAASIDMYHRDHPECALCSEDVCMAGAGCSCEQVTGVKTKETNARTGATSDVVVHLGECGLEWAKHEKSAKALAKSAQERLDRLVAQVLSQLLSRAHSVEDGVPTSVDPAWAEDRARNIVSGLIGELK